MEMLGTTYGPDWSMYGGDYSRQQLCTDSNLGIDGHISDEESTLEDEYDNTEGCVTATGRDARFISSLETERLKQSAPGFEQRYHYRYLASQLAESAADLLPPRSQAFAATLCHAASFVRNIDQDRYHALYQRYVRQGAYGFGNDFTFGCETPDFVHARTFERDHSPRSIAVAPPRPAFWSATHLWAALGRRPWLWMSALAVGLLGVLYAITSYFVRRRT
jgi:cellulose synthase operon protein C